MQGLYFVLTVENNPVTYYHNVKKKCQVMVLKVTLCMSSLYVTGSTDPLQS